MIVLIMIVAITRQIAVVNYVLSLNYEVSCCQLSRVTRSL